MEIERQMVAQQCRIAETVEALRESARSAGYAKCLTELAWRSKSLQYLQGLTDRSRHLDEMDKAILRILYAGSAMGHLGEQAPLEWVQGAIHGDCDQD